MYGCLQCHNDPIVLGKIVGLGSNQIEAILEDNKTLEIDNGPFVC